MSLTKSEETEGITQLVTDDGHIIGIATRYALDGGISLVIDNGHIVSLSSAEVVTLLDAIRERF